MRISDWSSDVCSSDLRTYADLATAEGLREIADYADGVGAHKNIVLPRDAAGATGEPSAFVDDAHAADLIVHVWTIRDENQFMATNFRIDRKSTRLNSSP